MANAAYWFKHDSNAKDDYKCMILIDQLGLEGYGIFWVLIETLREQEDGKYPLAMLPILAKRYGTSAEKMKAVVMNYSLFAVFEDETFASPALLKRMQAFNLLVDKRKVAGSLGGKQKKENTQKSLANAKQVLSTDVVNAKQQCSKPVASRVDRIGVDRIGVEENRDDKSRKEKIMDSKGKSFCFSHPSKQETLDFFLANGSNREGAAEFWYYYDSNGWNVGKNSMKNWHSAALRWINSNKNGTHNYGNGNRKPETTADAKGFTEEDFKQHLEWIANHPDLR